MQMRYSLLPVFCTVNSRQLAFHILNQHNYLNERSAKGERAELGGGSMQRFSNGGIYRR